MEITSGLGLGLNALFGTSAQSKQENAKPEEGKLTMGGQEVHSLAELRERFVLSQAMDALMDGSLEGWLGHCYYAEESRQVRNLKKENSPAVAQRLCYILGVDYAAQEGLPEEQQEVFSRRQELLRRHKVDTAAFPHVAETATNQMELAELLKLGCSVIYLCDGSFTVPIQKSGVHYIGIDRPRMEAPFTREQYRRAKITFERVDLPETADEQTERTAQNAARQAGYDDFGEKHNPLATLVHEAIKRGAAIQSFSVNSDASDVCEKEYHSKGAAERAGRAVVDRAYDEACALFSPSGSKCIAPKFAKLYAGHLHSGMDKLVERLKPQCTAERQKALLLQLEELTGQAEKNLTERFSDELRDSADYYEMYKRKHFLDRIAVEQDSPEVFVSDFMNGVARAISSTYTVSTVELLECITELQEDVDSRVDTFADATHQSYKEYCEKLEEIAEELGEGFTKDDLIRLRLVEG